VLPHSYELPAAVVLILSGALSCFAGYRLFRIVLAIYGFILGAMIASSVMGGSNTTGMLVAALVGGLAGAVILIFAYFVGVALVGAGLGALAGHLGWQQASRFGLQAASAGDPPALLIIALAVAGAIAAMVLQRYVIIVSTAFGGAWTVIVGTVGLVGALGARAASRGDNWILYPLTPVSGARWVPIAWVVLGLVGTAVQFGATARGKK
jgi:hypothetical protein